MLMADDGGHEHVRRGHDISLYAAGMKAWIVCRNSRWRSTSSSCIRRFTGTPETPAAPVSRPAPRCTWSSPSASRSRRSRSSGPASITGSTSISSLEGLGRIRTGVAGARRAYFFSTKATTRLWEAPLGASRDVVLIFGRETGGLPQDLHDRYRDRFVGMPILSPLVRSLNLSTSVGIAVYEVLRQQRAHEARRPRQIVPRLATLASLVCIASCGPRPWSWASGWSPYRSPRRDSASRYRPTTRHDRNAGAGEIVRAFQGST